MTVRATNLQNAPEGLPAEDHRLIRVHFQPASAGGLHAYSGVLPNAAGHVGEVTLLGPEALTVNPCRWVIAGTQGGSQGDYVVVNDAAVERAIGARDATLSRLDRLVVSVRDTAYEPNEDEDDADVRVVPGTPVLAGAVLPDAPPNSLTLGTITVPPGSGTVTFTPTIVPQQVAVGGVQPLRAGETAQNGAYDGQLLDHPTWGLRRWSAAAAAWGPLLVDRLRFANTTDVSLSSTGHPFQVGADNAANLVLDANQIQTRDGAGGVAWLGINTEPDDGVYGDVALGPATVHGDATGGNAQALEVPRLRITATNDAQEREADNSGTPSTLHPVQIGPDDAQHVIIDTNEGMARSATGATGAKVVPFLWHGLVVNAPTGASNPARLDTITGPVLRLARDASGGLTNNAWVPISWDAEAYDSHGMWGSGANVVCKRAGYYWVTTGFSVAAAAAGRRCIRVHRNGAVQPIGRGTGEFGSASDAGVEASGVLWLSVDDVVTVQVFQNSGSTQSVGTSDFARCTLHMLWQRGADT